MEVDEYFIRMAKLASMRGACIRRQTGCILTNTLNHVIATGYNGRARGVDNCYEKPCIGAEMASGTGLEQCEAIHAEANALLQCHNVESIKTAYCTTSPCIHCVKLLTNTGCERIVFQDKYPHNDTSKNLWIASAPWRKWEQFEPQLELFNDTVYRLCADCGLLKEAKCPTNHEDWLTCDRPTETDDTVYRRCADCGLLKEVCIV
jgi:dCMP deaminase